MKHLTPAPPVLVKVAHQECWHYVECRCSDLRIASCSRTWDYRCGCLGCCVDRVPPRWVWTNMGQTPSQLDIFDIIRQVIAMLAARSLVRFEHSLYLLFLSSMFDKSRHLCKIWQKVQLGSQANEILAFPLIFNWCCTPKNIFRQRWWGSQKIESSSHSSLCPPEMAKSRFHLSSERTLCRAQILDHLGVKICCLDMFVVMKN